MNKKKLLIPSVIGLAALSAVVAFSANDTLAYRGDFSKQGPNYSAQRHEVMKKAFEENDYNVWKEQMNNRGRVADVINEENFSRFAEAHKLGLAGETEKANEIRVELGLRTSNDERMGRGNGQGKGSGQGKGMRQGQNENRGQNQGGNFIDKDGDGKCDNLK